MTATTKRWLLAAVALFGVAAVLAWLNADGEVLRYDKGEAHVYDLAGQRLLAGAEVFRPDDRKPFTYPPAMALWFVPIAVLPDVAMRPVWYACNFLMLGLSLFLVVDMLRRAAGGFERRAAWTLGLAVALLTGRHVLSPIENQSNDLIVLLCVAAGVNASGRLWERRSGFWFGLGAATKATPLLFLPMLLLQKRWRAALFFGVGGALAVVLTEVLFPRQDGRFWHLVWFETFVSGVDAVGGNTARVGNAWGAWNIRNQNLASLIYRFSTPVAAQLEVEFDVSLWLLSGDALKYVTATCQFLVLAAVAWALRPGAAATTDPARTLRRLGEGGVVVCGMVLLSPMSSKSHFCVLLLPVAFLCFDYFCRQKSRVVLLCLVVMLLVTLTSKGIVGNKIGYAVLARGSVTWGTLAMLFGSVWVLERSRATSSSSGTQ